MQPQNPNPNQNPYPAQPQEPGQPNPDTFHRRPVQPIARRQFSPPPAPQQQPQAFNPQPPAKPVPAQPSVDSFSQPSSPARQQPMPQFTQPQPLAPKPVTPQPRPQAFGQQPLGPIQPSTTSNQLGGTLAPPTQPARPVPVRPRSASDINPDDMFTISDNRIQRSLPKTSKLPKGLFALAVIGVAALAVGLVDKSQHNMVFNTLIAINLLLAAGLFARKELVRKAAMGFAIATVTLSAALVLSYRGLTSSTVNAEAKFISEAKKLQNMSPTKQLTPEQQQHLDAMQLQLEAQQEAVGSSSTLVYAKYGTTVALYALVALYLTRPKVKEAFSTASSGPTTLSNR